MLDDVMKQNLGPLAALAGTWEGDAGDDRSPSEHRGPDQNDFRERIVWEPFGPVDNHEQKLWGLRYSTVAYKKGEAAAFHEETGYWLWDAGAQQVMRAFLVPRGIAVIAGGTVLPDATSFTLTAEVGSPTYGILSNKFLDVEFRTIRYDVKVEVLDADHVRYEEDTVMLMKGRKDLFHHIDKNTLRRVATP